ncbi:MAG: hypothetical protein ABSC50_00185 [Candidatus Bathyarchaeia archaeon]
MSVKIIPTGSGTVTLTPPGSPAGTYTPCVPISFKATPSAGYYFVGWALSAPGSTAGDGQMYYFTYQNPTPNFKLNATNGGNQRLLAYFQPQNQWVRSSNNPILTAAASGWDQSWVANSRVFTYQNGTYGMIYLGYKWNTDTRALGLATSPDGVHWTRRSSPVFTTGTGTGGWDSWSGMTQNGLVVGSVLWDGSKYLLYYSAASGPCNQAGCAQAGFGLATSTDTVTWTLANSGNPILTNITDVAQHPSTCSDPTHTFRYPDVVKLGSTYYMWYNRGGVIRLATSSDGISWTVQNDGCHVLGPADVNDPGTWPNLLHAYSWDGDFVFAPSVFYDPLAKGFKMFYSGCDVDCWFTHTGFATSTDGITWTKYAGNPVLSPMPGGFDNSDNVDNAAALLVNGQISLYYSADTVSSLVCREYYDPACPDGDGFTASSIGLAYVSEVPLFTGWNLFSTPIVPNNNLLKSILAPQLAAGEVTIVWSYTGTPRTWQKFIPPSTGTLTTIVDGNGYWIYMTAPDTLLVGGTVIPPGVAPPTYTLLAGWNLVGFKPHPVLGNETASQFLQSLGSNYDSAHVWVWDNYAGAWTKAGPSTWLVPGEALWVYVTLPAGATLRP